MDSENEEFGPAGLHSPPCSEWQIPDERFGSIDVGETRFDAFSEVALEMGCSCGSFHIGGKVALLLDSINPENWWSIAV